MNIHKVDRMPIGMLKNHPKNYKSHPEDQLAHIMQSIKEHGFYRNVVLARDHTILAGHGVVQAATRLGATEIPVIVLDLDPDEPRAIKVMVGDNEISHLAEIDDQLLIEHLNALMTAEELLGTGYDPQQLLAREMVCRPPDLLQPKNPESHWTDGMPEFEHGTEGCRLVVMFRTEQDRDQFVVKHKIDIVKRQQQAWSAWWPPQTEQVGTAKWKGAAMP